jgi:hypothetical protein
MEEEQEKRQWQLEEKSLLKALRESVDKAFERKKLSDQQAIKYFQSSYILFIYSIYLSYFKMFF